MRYYIEALLIVFSLWLGNKYKSRPNIIFSFMPLQPFEIKSPDKKNFSVWTTQVIISNKGLETASNVIVSHSSLPPNHLILPTDCAYRIDGDKIIIDKLRRNEWIVISYIQIPPAIAPENLIQSVKYDDGLAKFQPLTLTAVVPRWIRAILWTLIVISLIAIVGSIVWCVREILPLIKNYLHKLITKS